MVRSVFQYVDSRTPDVVHMFLKLSASDVRVAAPLRLPGLKRQFGGRLVLPALAFTKHDLARMISRVQQQVVMHKVFAVPQVAQV